MPQAEIDAYVADINDIMKRREQEARRREAKSRQRRR
jgi:hypothetical protein